MEDDKEYEGTTRDAHHQLLAYRRIAKKTAHKKLNFVIFVNDLNFPTTKIGIVCQITIARQGFLLHKMSRDELKKEVRRKMRAQNRSLT
ncbi:MAG: hypothetical protein II362_04050, partial [Alistipes sp.]|nr:hypothetical protein [Alistipes sp.]